MATYVDILVREIKAAGWSFGYTACRDADTGALVHVADAHKAGQRCLARADTELSAFMELRGLVDKAAPDDAHAQERERGAPP